MTARPRDWAPLALSDPVPGDPDDVRALARELTATAAHLRDVAERLRGSADDASWDSAAGRRFRSDATDTTALLDRAAQRHEAMAGAVAPYASELAAAQTASLGALARARVAQAELAAYDRVQCTVTTAGGRVDEAATADQQALLQRRRYAADDALRQAAWLLTAATAQRDEAAARAARLIQAAAADGLQDGWRDRVGGWLGDRWDDVADGFVGWVRDHADLVHAVQTVASTVATVVGLAALVALVVPGGQPVAALLGAVALGATGVSLAAGLALATVGEADGWGIAADVVGVVTFGIAAGASRAALAGARAAVPAARDAVVRTMRAGEVPNPTPKGSRIIAGLNAGAARALARLSRPGRIARLVFGEVRAPSGLAIAVAGRSRLPAPSAEALRRYANSRTLEAAREVGTATLARVRGINPLADAAATRDLVPRLARGLPDVDDALVVYRAARNTALAANTVGAAPGVATAGGWVATAVRDRWRW